jgi:hypothetical protein
VLQKQSTIYLSFFPPSADGEAAKDVGKRHQLSATVCRADPRKKLLEAWEKTANRCLGRQSKKSGIIESTLIPIGEIGMAMRTSGGGR